MRASFAMATLALLAVVLLGWTASGALAHAVLEAAAPEDGSRLEASPAEIVLRFSEPVALTKLQLLASEGGPAGGIGHPETDGGTIRIPVVRQLEAGSYVLSYRITSLDGHPVAGSVVFGIGTEAAASTSAADRVYWIAAVNRAINYGSLLAASGGGLFLLLVLGLDHVPGRIRLGLLFLPPWRRPLSCYRWGSTDFNSPGLTPAISPTRSHGRSGPGRPCSGARQPDVPDC
jgi:copper transport protein